MTLHTFSARHICPYILLYIVSDLHVKDIQPLFAVYILGTCYRGGNKYKMKNMSFTLLGDCTIIVLKVLIVAIFYVFKHSKLYVAADIYIAVQPSKALLGDCVTSWYFSDHSVSFSGTLCS